MNAKTALLKTTAMRNGTDERQLALFGGQIRQEDPERRKQIHAAALLYQRHNAAITDDNVNPTYWWKKE